MTGRKQLSESIADALRGELESGRYRAGKALPSVAELCKRFGAGAFAVRSALRKLRDEGFVAIKKHVGAIVSQKAACPWKGRVAFVAVGTPGSYFMHKQAVLLGERLRKRGYDLTTLFLGSQKDVAVHVDDVLRLAVNGLSFAVCYCSERQFVEVFDRAHVPYIILDGFARDFPNARAVVRADTRKCYGKLIRALREGRVKNLLEVDFERVMDRSFKSQFVAAGISVQRLLCKWSYESPMRLVDVRRIGHEAVRDFFADERHRAHPPDAILFDDDYLAEGGLVALLEAGLRVPNDVKVVTFCNKGNEPFLGVSLARIENDPVAYADTVAEFILKLLAGRSVKPPNISSRFIPGESL